MNTSAQSKQFNVKQYLYSSKITYGIIMWQKLLYIQMPIGMHQFGVEWTFVHYTQQTCANSCKNDFMAVKK